MIRAEDETTSRVAVVVDPITSLWGKPKRRILRHIFRSLRVFRAAKHTYLKFRVRMLLKGAITTSDVFVTCDTTQRTGLNLSASASGCWIWVRAQILNGPIRVEDETTLRAAVVVDPITSLWGKPKRRILRQIFRSLRAFRPAKHTNLEWNLLRFGTFLFEEKVICGVTSGQRWMEWFPY